MKTVHVSLDARTERALVRLMQRFGLSAPAVIRNAIHLLAVGRPVTREIVGLGKFSSDLTDLGSNKERLNGFGQ